MENCNTESSHVKQRYIKSQYDEAPQKYEFVTVDNKDLVFSPTYDSLKVTRYYQICTFKDPYSNKYNARRFVTNVNNEFVDIKNIRINDRQFKKIMDLIPSNKYKLFSTYSLDHIPYPSFSDILTAQSDMLCSDNQYTGCAPFT